MRRSHRRLVPAVSVILSAAMTFSVPAAPTGPGVPPEREKYDAETLERLKDNVLEFDEIELRVREYNPTISEAWRSYRDAGTDYANMLTELESQYDTVVGNADSLTKLGQMMANPELIATGKMLGASYKQIVKGVRDVVDKWDNNKTATSQITMYERQMTAGAQSAMIGYDTIRRNIATLETMVQLYRKQYEMVERQVGLGLATQTQLTGAEANLLGAQSKLASLSAQLDSTRRTLCLLLGYDPDTDPDIRPLPEFDVSRLEKMDLEADTKKAIGNNYTLISQRHSAQGNTQAQIDNRMKMIDEGDQKLTIEMQRLYQDVMDKKAAYDAALTGFTAAEMSRGAAERQYQNGLISELQYVGSQISYHQKKAAKEAAELSLWQAMETYDWGVIGLATVE